MANDEFWDHYFGNDDTDLDDAIEAARPYVYPTRAQMYEALHHANASAKRLDGTMYWAGTHAAINQLLDDIVGR